MITLRCTKTLRDHLGMKPGAEEVQPSSALGDWYGNLIMVPGGKPLVIFVNERSLLSVLVPHKADALATFRERLVRLLRTQGVPAAKVEEEAFHLRRIAIGKTANRRVIGSMNEVSFALQHILDPGLPRDVAARNTALDAAEDQLATLIQSYIDHQYPVEVARRLLGTTA